MASLQRSGLLNYANYLAKLPFIKDIAEGAEVISQRQRAIDLTKKYFFDSRKPLFIASEIQATTTPVKAELAGVEDVIIPENEDVLNFIKPLSEDARKKILGLQ